MLPNWLWPPKYKNQNGVPKYIMWQLHCKLLWLGLKKNSNYKLLWLGIKKKKKNLQLNMHLKICNWGTSSLFTYILRGETLEY